MKENNTHHCPFCRKPLVTNAKKSDDNNRNFCYRRLEQKNGQAELVYSCNRQEIYNQQQFNVDTQITYGHTQYGAVEFPREPEVNNSANYGLSANGVSKGVSSQVKSHPILKDPRTAAYLSGISPDNPNEAVDPTLNTDPEAQKELELRYQNQLQNKHELTQENTNKYTPKLTRS